MPGGKPYATIYGVNHIYLTGQLICQDDAETSIVAEFLPRHIESTRAEPGCVSFEVHQSDDPLVWDVAEQFRDAVSFRLHQARVSASEWGQATAAIKRSYSVTGE